MYVSTNRTERAIVGVICYTNTGSSGLPTSNDTPSATTAVHETWLDSETRFLLSQMQPLVRLNDELPSTLAELERRLKMNRGKKEKMWEKVAKVMTDNFHMLFNAKHVARKWFTLVDGYKKAVENNGSTGQGTSRYRWLTEMGELIGDQHDVNFVATGTAQGVTVHRPEAIQMGNAARDNTSDGSSAEELLQGRQPLRCGAGTSREQQQEPQQESQQEPNGNRSRGRKRKADHSSDTEKILKFLQESDERAAMAEDKMLQEMTEMANCMKTFMQKMIEKM